MAGDIDIYFERRGSAGVITLDRQSALNAINDVMLRGISKHLTLWENDTDIQRVIIKASPGRAFSAGGDIRHIYESGARGEHDFDFFAREYALNARIAAYPKDYVALVNGIAMGGGVGVSFHGSHRVVGENASFAMPEVGIGFFPDVGGSYLLSRMQDHLGLYLGLTGARLKSDGILESGLATHACKAADFDELEEALCGAEPTDVILSRFSEEKATGALADLMNRTDKAFSADSIVAIIKRLRRLREIGGTDGDWADQTLEALAQKSPLSISVAFHEIRQGASLAMAECMRMEYRILRRILPSPNFHEGIRAAIIDKDNRPAWNPARLEDVTSAMVDSHFQALGADELVLD